FCSSFIYIKFFLVWLLVIAADFLFEFRFEYLWPFWLLLRSVYDSFRYQGLAFSVLFVCMALTSDMICLLFIPVNWLFFAASTYVWVQFIWHSEKGVCLPSVILWVIFIYIEALVRLKDHWISCCNIRIGLKSYVGYRLRQRRQREVAKENEFYVQLLQEALPPELQSSNNMKSSKNKEELSINGDLEIASNLNHIELAYMQKKGWSSSKTVNDYDEAEAEKDKSAKTLPSSTTSSSHHNNSSSSGGGGGGGGSSGGGGGNANAIHAAPVESSEKKKSNTVQSNGSIKFSGTGGHHTNNLKESTVSGSTGSAPSKEKKNKNNKENNKEASAKEESVNIIRARQTEQELRNQINNLLSNEKAMRQEMNQLHQDNDNLQNKLHNLVTARQNDRSTITSLEKKLQEERRSKQNTENQIAQLERRAKKLEEQNQARAQALANAKSECSESCRSRRGEIEGEVKRLRRENRSNEERFRGLERENLTLRQYKDSQSETEVLMSALSAMQDKNTHLESSLSAETKVKLDLFSALGEAKRQLSISQNQITTKDKEIEELKTKITEVLALCPPTATFPPGNAIDVSRYYSSKILPPQVTQINPQPLDCSTPLTLSEALMDGGGMVDPLVGLTFAQAPPRSLPQQSVSSPIPKNAPPPHSNLDPNARVYTPKGISGVPGSPDS
ncbi:Macoilin-1, partial [Armadillidium nasatum]